MFSNTKLSVKIAILIAMNLLFTAILGVVAAIQMDKIGDEIHEIAATDLPLIRTMTKATEHLLEQASEFERALKYSQIVNKLDASERETRYAKKLQNYDALSTKVQTELAESKEIINNAIKAAHTEQTRSKLAALSTEIAEVESQFQSLKTDAQNIIQLLDSAQVQKAYQAMDQFEAKQHQMVQAIDKALADVEQFTEDAAVTAESDEIAALQMIIAVALVSLLFGVILGAVFVRSISTALVESSSEANTAATQLLAAVQEQSSTSSETASAVSQTSATVDELQQTAQSASQRADEVLQNAEQSLESSVEAQSAVNDGIDSMTRIKDEVEQIAQSILELSEKSIQIGDVITTVSDIAEQSNLLAVNASIEAAKAGEYGKGFAVVANEVKQMAVQSKEATERIKKMLTDIQKSSNAAVMVTEQGVKRVEEGSQIVEKLGSAIEMLATVIEDNADSSRQIQMTSSQQLAGISQIGTAMENIGQATRDSNASAQQVEEAARNITLIAEKLVAIVNGSK